MTQQAGFKISDNKTVENTKRIQKEIKVFLFCQGGEILIKFRIL